MNSKTEKNIVLYYLNNLLKRPTYGEFEAQICNWFENIAPELLGVDVEPLWWGYRQRIPHTRNSEESKLARDHKTIRQFIAGQIGELVFDNEVSAIIEAFHLSQQYHEILAFRIYAETIPMLEQMFSNRHTDTERELSPAMAGLSRTQYEKYFSSNSELTEKGLFCRHRHRDWNNEMTETLKKVLESHCRTPEAVKRVILGKPFKGTLKPEHFEHIGDDYTWLKTLLTNAVKKRNRGVNVLIYGNPGTGKTELAKTLCNEIGLSLYSVSGNRSYERGSTERRSDLAAALSLLQEDRNSVLLMDEAEDVFGASRTFSGFLGFPLSETSSSPSKSKLFFHKLLASNAVPVVWICNSIRGVDPAHLRRFSYALKMESPDETVQQRIWAYSAKKHKVKLPENKIRELTTIYDIAPAIIDTSLRTAALTNDHAAIEKTIDALQTAMHGQSKEKEKTSDVEFLTALLNCDTNLENLTQRILGIKCVNFSLCLYGIPGSGKSAYARYLADKMKMKVLHKRASDLLSMWVGESEKNIAAAFAEARKKKILLVIDEADSFLQDRSGAQYGWEVTRVNEMLTQMESHPLPFVCTTNLMEGLDKASLRRFTFKVKYDYLKRPQVQEAFKYFFGTESTVSLNDLTCLAPGDFAVVAKKAKICGIDDHKELVEMLHQEQMVKDVKSHRIGFTA
ncbi:hypothetical protein FACS1894170_05770 [Planctomycetales bacterium]|nr:hypothetical protein FACS1894170_05770 [Planctomycetales bacterium]